MARLQMQWCSGDEIGGCVEMQESFHVQMINPVKVSQML